MTGLIVQTLRQHHGAFDGKPQFARSLLLEIGSDEGGNREEEIEEKICFFFVFCVGFARVATFVGLVVGERKGFLLFFGRSSTTTLC